jgi:hypothetical protein
VARNVAGAAQRPSAAAPKHHASCKTEQENPSSGLSCHLAITGATAAWMGHTEGFTMNDPNRCFQQEASLDLHKQVASTSSYKSLSVCLLIARAIRYKPRSESSLTSWTS